MPSCSEVTPLIPIAPSTSPPTLALKPLADPAFSQEIDRGLLQNSGADTFDHVILCAVFNDEGVDPREVQQVAQHQTCRSRSDDSYLSAQ